MIVLAIILVILILLLSLKVGVDAAYSDGVFSLKVLAGPAKITLLPKKDKEQGEKSKTKKEKKQKPARSDGQGEEKKKPSGKVRAKPGIKDILEIAKLALKTLGRFFKSLRMDRLCLSYISPGPDPYSAVMNYGYFNAAVGAVLPLIHRVFKVGKEEISSAVDFEADKMKIDAELALTIRIGQILFIALCAGIAFLRWYLRIRRRAKLQAKAEAANQSVENKITQPEKG